MEKEFNRKDFLKSVAAIGIPVALQNLLTTAASMVDTIMIAPLGENTVGAAGLCVQFGVLFFQSYWGFVGGSVLFFSQYWGSRDHEGIKRSFGLLITCMSVVTSLFSVAAIAFPEVIMRIYTDKTAIREIGVRYLRIVGFAYPLQLYAVCVSTLLRTTDRVRIPLYASIVSVFTNIFLNWVFIYGHLGAPAMGIAGAALATVFAALVNVLMMVVFCIIKKYPYLFAVRDHFRWKKDKTREYFKKCFPIICNEVANGIAALVIGIVMGHQNESAIAAIAVLRTIENFVISFFAGFSSASSVLVGNAVGAGKLDLAYTRAKNLIPVNTCGIFCVAVLINLLKPVFMPLMGLSGESYAICSRFILIYTSIALIRMNNWLLNDTYRASGDAVTGTVLEISFMYLMVLPLVCLAGLKWRIPVAAVFALCYCDEPVRICLMLRQLFSGRWIRPVTQNGREALSAFLARRNVKRKALR